MAAAPAPHAPHARRIAVAWVVGSVILTPLAVLLLGPHLPPGHRTLQASDQTSATTLILGLAVPITVGLLCYFGYSLVVFRARSDDDDDAPAIHGHARMQITWIVVTSAIVLFLAVYGSVELWGASAGVGGGSGPDPVAVPSGPKLQVQVVAQEWAFTFRYPQYGGLETAELVLPIGRQIEFHVTSLDVTHSFWAYELGVKADAVPGVDNIAFLKTEHTSSFKIVCGELCGLFHNAMTGSGRVVSQADFAAWIAARQRQFASEQQYLPAFGGHYFPDPQRRAG